MIIQKTLTLPKHKDIILSSMTQKTEKWDSLVMSKAEFWMVWRYHGIPFFHFYFFCLEVTVKITLGWERFFVMVMVIISKVPFWNLLDISCFQSSHQLWDTLQWKILLNIRVNSFLDKSHETKMGEDALDIISCAKIRSCSLRNIVPRHFTYYYIL